MAARLLSSRLRSHLVSTAAILRPSTAAPLRPPSSSDLRPLSTAVPPRRRLRPGDIGARARQLQNRRLWTYALTFSCVAGFIIIVLNQFQDALVFYVTPTDALQKFQQNPTRKRFRLGGLVLEGSVVHPSASSPEMEFVVTDLITDILVRFDGSLPDLFREGHSCVVEGFLKPFDAASASAGGPKVSHKAKALECFFQATEVLAKHDEKYMPKEVADALERNKKLLEEGDEQKVDGVKS